jgi:hypothetical protein
VSRIVIFYWYPHQWSKPELASWNCIPLLQYTPWHWHCGLKHAGFWNLFYTVFYNLHCAVFHWVNLLVPTVNIVNNTTTVKPAIQSPTSVWLSVNTVHSFLVRISWMAGLLWCGSALLACLTCWDLHSTDTQRFYDWHSHICLQVEGAWNESGKISVILRKILSQNPPKISYICKWKLHQDRRPSTTYIRVSSLWHKKN